MHVILVKKKGHGHLKLAVAKKAYNAVFMVTIIWCHIFAQVTQSCL